MSLKNLDHPKLSSDEYTARIGPLQLKLMRYQQAIYKTGKRALMVVEGTDAAGKGGMIKRVVELMDPRGVRVHPIGAPTSHEISTHYLKRFWTRIPHHGQFVVFDRSWYGRVLVERVEQLTPKKDWFRAYREINDFERLLVDDDIILVKFFLTVDKKEQKKRFLSRLKSPEKCWKITPDDIRSRTYWNEYQEAYEDMFDQTDTKLAPWHIVPANCKKYARISCMETVCEVLGEVIDLENLELIDPDFKTKALKELDS